MKIIRVVSALAVVLLSPPVWAYYSVLDNGEIMQKGHYKLTGAGQILTDNGGLDLTAIYDGSMSDEYGFRGLFGVGRTDMFMGGMFKWMPIPDIEGQPAIGLNAGVLYAKDADRKDLTIRVEPIISKKLKMDANVITPYVSMPLGIRMRNSDHNDRTVMPLQLVLGSQLQTEMWKNMQFIAEVGLELNEAPSYVAAAAVFYFDENGIDLKGDTGTGEAAE